MKEDFAKIERELDREVERLRVSLSADAPAPRLIARVQLAVVEEAQRRKRRTYRLLTLQAAFGAAAALLLVLFFAWPSRPRSALPPATSEASFSDWVAALDETDSRFAALLSTDWLVEGSNQNGDSGDSNGLFNSLDESFRLFESIIGT